MDLSIYWHHPHERFTHFLMKVYKGLLRTRYTFSCCFCPFIFGLDANKFFCLAFCWTQVWGHCIFWPFPKIPSILSFLTTFEINYFFFFFCHKPTVRSFRIAPLEKTSLTQRNRLCCCCFCSCTSARHDLNVNLWPVCTPLTKSYTVWLLLVLLFTWVSCLKCGFHVILFICKTICKYTNVGSYCLTLLE